MPRCKWCASYGRQFEGGVSDRNIVLGVQRIYFILCDCCEDFSEKSSIIENVNSYTVDQQQTVNCVGHMNELYVNIALAPLQYLPGVGV